MAWLPDAFYFVTTDLGQPWGFCAAGDFTTDRDAAMDQYTEARDNGQPARVFHVEHGAGLIEDVTGEVMTAAFAMWAARRQQPPEWAVEGQVAV